MFDSVRNNKRIVQTFLALITLPFAFFGVDSYIRNASSGGDVATVGSSAIGIQEFQNALREQGERMRAQLGAQFDPRLLDAPDTRRAVVNGLINQRLLTLAAHDKHLRVSDQSLVDFLAAEPSLQEDGKFSPERYQSLVASRGMTTETFEARLRQDMALQQLVQPVGEATVVSKQAAARFAQVQLEQRDIAEFRLAPESYLKQVTLESNAEQAYYEANRETYAIPEQVRLAYVVLDRDTLGQQTVVSDADLEARYKAHPERYTQAETRRASHILLTVDKDAKAADVAAIRTRAETLLAQIKANPTSFAELAKKNSQDPGSAERGGDLDWIGRGMMVKPFEEAVFALKTGETSGIVQSDFGLHIIRLTDVRPAKVTPFAEVKADIAADARRESAARQFAEAVETFTNLVYEQPDTLQPAADQWKLPVQTSDWLRKGAVLPSPFDNAKLASAVFADEAVTRKHNTEAVEFAPGKLISARVVEHKPAAVQPFESVKAAITQTLLRKKAAERAAADGQDRLARLQSAVSQASADTIAWGAARPVLRAAPRGLPPEAARPLFAADAGKLPAYAGFAAADGGYTLYKVSRVIPAAKDDPRAAVLTQQYTRLVAEEEFAAWLAGLRKHYGVTINEALLERKDN